MDPATPSQAVTSSPQQIEALSQSPPPSPPPAPTPTAVVPKRSYPLALIGAGLTLTVAVVGGAIGYTQYITSAHQEAPSIAKVPLATLPSTAPSPTDTPQGKSLKFLSLMAEASSASDNPFLIPTPTIDNPFGEYQNPFEDETTSPSESPYQNPFEETTP